MDFDPAGVLGFDLHMLREKGDEAASPFIFQNLDLILRDHSANADIEHLAALMADTLEMSVARQGGAIHFDHLDMVRIIDQFQVIAGMALLDAGVVVGVVALFLAVGMDSRRPLERVPRRADA